MNDEEFCWSCGYSLLIHWIALYSMYPDPNGGCPANEAEAIIRWGV